MEKARLINMFSEKILILRPNIGHPHNSVSPGKIFLKFCTKKGANRKMRMILIIFQKIVCLGQMDHFGPKNGPSL